jgi:hypothetical protein
MADLRISELAALAGANLAAGDLLPIADVSASETKRITVTDLVGNATTLIADATIPSAKILFNNNTIPGASLTTSSVTATQLANDAVTAAKLADESSVDLVTTLPGSGAFVGQLALDTDDSKIYCWDGSTWVSVKGAGSVNAVLGGTAGVINIVATTVGDEVTISATLDNTSTAAQFLAGPTASAGTVGYRTIAGADLPTATTTTKGAVIVNGNGLTLAGDTISIDNTVTSEATNYHIVQYNAKGLVTAGRVINSGDVPVATTSTVGVIAPGSGLTVTGAGTLNHTNVVGAGSGTKISFDAEGHVTAAQALLATDIPDLSATKITSGTLDIARIGTNAVTGSKLANFSVSKIGQTQPTPDFSGQFFFNPLSRDLFLWDGNVYQPIGISAGEIVFAGTYNATTNLLTSVTAEGTAAGFTNGSPLPSAAAINNRYYVVVATGGTGTSPAPTVALQPPDIILSNGSSYVLIDVSETVTSQVATNVVFTPTGNISAVNVQSAIAEVDTEKVAKAGDLMTGALGITAGSAASPSLYISGDTNTGIYSPGADQLAISTNGTQRLTVDTAATTSTLPVVHPLGAVGTPSITFTGDLNTGIYSPAADTIAFVEGGAEATRIDSSGRLLLGTSSSRAQASLTGQIQLEGTTSSASTLQIINNSSASTAGGIITLGKTRAGTIGGITIVSSGDLLGEIRFAGADGAGTQVPGGSIQVQCDGTPGTNDMPGRLILATTADGASSPSERMRIDNQGRIGFNSTSLGGNSGQYRFAGSITGAVSSQGIVYTPTVQPDVTTTASIFNSQPSTAANAGTPYTVTNLYGYFASQGTFNADSTVTSQYGFAAANTLTGATNNYGFISALAAATGRWNFYAAGTANNYFAGNVGIGSGVTAPASALEINAAAATSPFIAKINTSEVARIDSSGRLLIGTSSNSGGALLQVNGDRVRVATAKTPASATDTGTAGEICWDASYIYVCTATNTWKRTAIATW